GFSFFRGRLMAGAIVVLAAAQLNVSGNPIEANRAVGQTASGFGSLPMQFEPNVGQAEEQVRFLSRGPGYTLLITPKQAILTLHKFRGPKEGSRKQEGEPAELRMTLAGAAEAPRIAGLEPLPGTVNYFVGNHPENALTAI